MCSNCFLSVVYVTNSSPRVTVCTETGSDWKVCCVWVTSRTVFSLLSCKLYTMDVFWEIDKILQKLV